MLWVVVAVLAVALDQAVKYLATAQLKPVGDMPLIDGVFHLSYVTNSGASWGMLEGKQTLFTVMTLVSLAVAVWLLYFSKYRKSRLFCWAMALIIGGAVGNFIDRLRFGYVVDMFYIKLINFPVFNVADLTLTAGAICLIVYILFYSGKEDKHGK